MMRTTKYLAAVVARGAVVGVALVLVLSCALAGAEPAPAENQGSPQTLLFVRTTPAGAEVRLDGKKLGKSDGLFPVDPGPYKIVVDLAGHQPHEQQITIEEGRITRIELTLTKQPRSAAAASAFAEPLPNDDLLNEAQRLYRDWTAEFLERLVDPSPWQNLSDEEKGAKEKEWLEQLASLEGRARIPAINALAAIGSKKAVPGLLKIAAERAEKNNRDRWMATRALGLLGDRSVVPELVHLTYHYNQNTRFWAQISLVRLTGQNFGRDVAAWARWWEAQGGSPPISEQAVAWATSAEIIPYADPDKQEESDRQFVERAKGRAQQAEPPRGDVPQDAKLTDAQRLFRDWTDQQFGGLLSAAAPQNLGDEEKAAKEEEWIDQLATLEGRARNPAINGLAILRSKKAVPGLLKVAADRAERDNQDRWMAVRALGMIGDRSAVPDLVHLTYHYNLNTRWWAQISLVRLTGENFGRDVAAWARWWKAQGGSPPISEETVVWATSPQMAPYADPQKQAEYDRQAFEKMKQRAGQSAAPSGDPQKQAEYARQFVQKLMAPSQPNAGASAGPPQIVATSPPVGATDVDPATSEITVTFDREMSDSFSWTGGGPEFPTAAEGKSVVWRERRTCVLPVKLEPGRFYRVGINSTSFQNFRSVAGVPAEPSAIYFTTQGASEELKARVRKPQIVSMTPPNEAKDVDPALAEIRVTFSVPMGGGFSWTGGGPQFPKIAEGKGPSWSEDRKTCVLPVELKPGWQYRLGLNSPSHKNFQSQGGVPLEPVVYTFTTRAE